jgi:GNAT superfamily N-acetyltransferase
MEQRITMNLQALMQLEADYACFNRKRTLSRVDYGNPEWNVQGTSIRIQDPSWPENTYVNRITTASLMPVESRDVKQIDVFNDDISNVEETVIPGFNHSYTLNFFKHDLRAASERLSNVSEIQIELCDDAPRFISEIGRSIEKSISSDIIEAKRSLYCTSTFRCYLAQTENKVVGHATLFISGDHGWCANAFTYPEERGRGIQSALLRRRLADARSLGLDSVFTDVESNSPSERNVRRQGFTFVAAAKVFERSG